MQGDIHPLNPQDEGRFLKYLGVYTMLVALGVAAGLAYWYSKGSSASASQPVQYTFKHTVDRVCKLEPKVACVMDLQELQIRSGNPRFEDD